MTAIAHTPGPWLKFPQHHDRFKVGDYNGGKGPYRVIVDCDPDTTWAMNGAVGRPMSCAEAEANARLIAAAPELLEALKSAEYAVKVTRATLMDSVDTHGTHGGWLHSEALRLDSELDLIRAAIAKATGGSEH